MSIDQQHPAVRRLIGLSPYALLFGLFFWPVAMGEWFSGGDIINQYLPWKDFWRRSVWSGDWPLWNPLTFSGMPFQGNIQVGQMYPPNWLFLLIPAAPCYTLIVLLHFAFGAWGMNRLAGRLVDSRGARFVAVVAFAFTGYFISRLYWGVVIFGITAAWLPWMIDAMIAGTQDPRPRRWLLLGAMIALQLFSGAPQMVFYSLLAVVIWAPIGKRARSASGRAFGTLLVQRDRQLPRYNVKLYGGLAAALAISAALALVQLWPTYDYTQASYGRAGGASLEYVAGNSMAPRLALTQVAPFFFMDPLDEGMYWAGPEGFHEFNAYAGWVVYLLAFVGLIAGKHWAVRRDRDEGKPVRRAMVFYAVTLVVLSVLLCFGSSPLFRFCYRFVPGFDMFRVTSRVLLLGLVGMSLLAAVGWEALLHGAASTDRVRRRAGWAVCVFAGVSVVGLLSMAVAWRPVLQAAYDSASAAVTRSDPGRLLLGGLSLDNPSSHVADAIYQARLSLWKAFSLALAVSAVGLLCAARLRGSFKNPRLAGLVLSLAMGALLLGDLVVYGGRFVETMSPREFQTEVYRESRLAELLRSRADQGRLVYTDHVFSYLFDQNQPELYSARSMMFGMPQMRGYNPMLLRRYVEFAELWRGPMDPPSDGPGGFLKFVTLGDLRLLNVWNPRTVISYMQPQNPELTPIASMKFPIPPEGARFPNLPTQLIVYDNAAAQGDAWLATAHPLLDEADDESLALLRSPEFDLRRRVIVHVPLDEDAPQPAWDDSLDAVEVGDRDADALRLRARSAPGRVLVTPISYYTGWQATIDGKPARLYRANHAMMGVVLPGGEVEVAFRFRPVSFVWGGMISAIAWLLWLAAWIRTKKRDDDSAIDEGAVS